jgi:phosphoribosylglycinamide formyltransferase-1
MRLGFLASHEGSTMQSVIDACKAGRLNADVTVVISNNSNARALLRASEAGIPEFHLSSRTHPDPAVLDAAICQTLRSHGVDIVFLAGYMKQLGPITLSRFPGRILNTHPALLPKFGGQGMYGHRVHEAVLASGDRESGVSVHIVAAEYDTGPVLAQTRVLVERSDTVEALSRRVHEREVEFVVEVLGDILRGGTQLPRSEAAR